jgi:hypothetical protein
VVRPYVIYPEAPGREGGRAYGSLEAARKGARKIANETGYPVQIWLIPRFGGGSGRRLELVYPVRERNADLQADVDHISPVP